MSFQKAEKKQAKLKLAITGPSGSGKTYSALRLAKGMGGRIAVVDTENKSASLYADKFDFDVLEIEPPYTNEKYLQALVEAVKAKYDIVIIDSLSHQWAGEGGLLNKKEQMDARGGNSFQNWAKMTPEHEKFKMAILHADINIIGTMRSKQDYVMETNDKGKQAPKKVGLAPIQREGLEYEFTTVFDVAMNHEAVASKDRTGLFVDKIFQVTEQTGVELKTWLMSGKPVEASQPGESQRTTAPGAQTSTAPAAIGTSAANPAPVQNQAPTTPTTLPTAAAGSVTPWTATKLDLDRLIAAGDKRWKGAEITELMKQRYNKDRLGLVTKEEYDQLINGIRNFLPAELLTLPEQNGVAV